ncbi:unnamed protein product [Symbiodinium necroappetens]|uniref:Uncharacterized protein n=1 Tax=Symbiodinium necroappetens TaxID=1628268 RepID=A0A812X2R4_9DINO|nr:unnamed protein product [Symbiodinium necroappetens]|mmetsp:Transcript_24103/g.57127  ORF Transcript_24103/g.57127 Transcript_24103/m.57127 type:complete len:288 (+) Transcript_24103:71-934(+)
MVAHFELLVTFLLLGACGANPVCPFARDSAVRKGTITHFPECARACPGMCGYVDSALLLRVGGRSPSPQQLDELLCRSEDVFSCVWKARECSALLEDMVFCPLLRAPASRMLFDRKCKKPLPTAAPPKPVMTSTQAPRTMKPSTTTSAFKPITETTTEAPPVTELSATKTAYEPLTTTEASSTTALPTPTAPHKPGLTTSMTLRTTDLPSTKAPHKQQTTTETPQKPSRRQTIWDLVWDALCALLEPVLRLPSSLRQTAIHLWNALWKHQGRHGPHLQSEPSNIVLM